MDNTELKTAEKKGYSNGYAAGLRRKNREVSYASRQKKKDAFWQRAFLAVLPAAFEAQNWTRGSKPISTLPDRLHLAAETADEALKIAMGHL